MKLMQTKSPSRTYLGVTFPQGEAVELPASFPADQVRFLLAWGWTVVEDVQKAVEAEAETEDAVVTFDEEVPHVRRGRRR
jgi:hypothetical protein